MNNIILKTIGICIIASLLIPVTVGLKCTPNDTNAPTGTFITVFINKIDDDGHLIFNVSNYALQCLSNATIYICLYGSSPFIRCNQVDIHTELFIQHLSGRQSGLFKTKDQVFKVRPIFRRPVIPFFYGEITTAFNGYTIKTPITKLMMLVYSELVIIPYP